MHDDLVVAVHEELDYVVLRLGGCLSRRNIPRVRQAALTSLRGKGRVLIDLSRLRSRQAAFVTVFPTVLAVAGGWPSARLVLFGADAALGATLLSTRVPETVPLAADLPSARALLDQRPSQVRRGRDLPARNTAPAIARRFVRETCAAWSVPQAVQEIAELMSNELVSNAVEHAHSPSRLTITCTDSTLRVSVQDYCPERLPQSQPKGSGASRGRGLHLVAALAQGWGVDQHPDGKTVWVSLQLQPHD
jgi:anti-sigma regulatory factor (Ser/Thr protein kinase)